MESNCKMNNFAEILWESMLESPHEETCHFLPLSCYLSCSQDEETVVLRGLLW